MQDNITALFKSLAPAVDFCSLRLVEESAEQITVRQDILQPISATFDTGAMITVIHRGGYGYAATQTFHRQRTRIGLRQQRHYALRLGKVA